MKLVLSLWLLASVAPAHADEALQHWLDDTLASTRTKYEVPAIAALVQIDGRIAASSVTGVRAVGHAELATRDDEWHIGSDTKAFTAALIVRLSERGVLALDDTLAMSLPSLASHMDAAYREVTIKDLLSHTAGLPGLTDPGELPEFRRAIASATTLPTQRMAVARSYLAKTPANRRGEFRYSNLGYIIAGAIAESRTGRSWEDLMRTEVFAPLGIASAGFGPPGVPHTFDQPHGHRARLWGLVPLDPGDPDADNPPALGPAGTLHLRLADWMRFAQDQLDGMHGRGKLLTESGYRLLHTPVTSQYALGWGVIAASDGLATLLAHTGSNGYWLADVRIRPRPNAVVLVAMNAANERAQRALQDIDNALRERLEQPVR